MEQQEKNGKQGQLERPEKDAAEAAIKKAINGIERPAMV